MTHQENESLIRKWLCNIANGFQRIANEVSTKNDSTYTMNILPAMRKVITDIMNIGSIYMPSRNSIFILDEHPDTTLVSTEFDELVDVLTMNPFIVNVGADGNCFFRALSVCLYGTEKYHVQFRCATVFELYRRLGYYYNVFKHSRFIHNDARDKPCDLDFLKILIDCCSMGCWIDSWLLYPVSNFIRRPIYIYYPHYPDEYGYARSYFPDRSKSSQQSIPILMAWSSKHAVHYVSIIQKKGKKWPIPQPFQSGDAPVNPYLYLRV
jgi:hypothetical protein